MSSRRVRTWGWFRFGWLERGYMRRMALIPQNRFFNLYVHVYDGPDPRREHVHDHPWWSYSVTLWGALLIERLKDGTVRTCRRVELRSPGYAHALLGTRTSSRRTVTLFFTGPRCRDWGFYVPVVNGFRWVEANEYFARYVGEGSES